MKEYNGYYIEHLGTFPMVKVKNKGQGPCPKFLAGYFTTVTEAQRAIDSYLSSKKKGVTNGSAEDSGKG